MQMKKIGYMIVSLMFICTVAAAQTLNAVDLNYIEEYQKSPIVAAYKWNLDKSCPDTDICHMYAEADMFNLGQGIFPKNLIPIAPVHTGCKCYLSALTTYDTDLGGKRQQIDKAGNDWLMSLAETERHKLFASADYGTWYDTALWQPFMKGWKGVAAPNQSKSRLLSMELNLQAPSDEFIQELAVNQGSKYTVNKQGVYRFYDDAGEPVWPSNKGFYGKPKPSVLPAGKVVDKLGVQPRGKFLADAAVSRAERAVPDQGKYLGIYQTVHTFSVTAPTKVYSGLIAPWFGEPGMGVQYFVPQGIENTSSIKLLDSKKVEAKLKNAA